jgi:Ca-activated chloride channel homolog
MKRISLFLLVLCCIMLHDQAGAIGRVYARWPNSPSSPIYNLRIKSLHANVEINDQFAVTRVDQTFANDNAMRLEGFYVFKLPEGAQVHELYLWINGIRVPYIVKKKEDAIVQYEQIVRGMADPAVLQELGDNRFQLRIFPIDANSTRRIEIMYSQLLTFYKGSIQYVFPMDMHDYTSTPIEQATVSIAVNSQIPITGIQTSVDQFPTAVVASKTDSLHWTVGYGVENVAFAKDFKIQCALAPSTRTMLAQSHHNVVGPGAFVLWTNIPDTLSGDSAKARELTFVADISSSMEGDRMAQLKQALVSFIDLLTDRDRFNIITFSTGTAKFKPDLVQATGAIKIEARSFVEQLVALGMTNFEEAFHQGLLQSYQDSTHRALIFMTDGQPNWGETRPDSLLARIARWNTPGIGLFPVAVGGEPDKALLQSIAQQSGGTFMQIASDDSIYLKMKDLFRLLFLPKFRTPAFNFSQISVTELFPSPLPDVYVGDQLIVSGRYSAGGTIGVSLHGTVSGTPMVLSEDVDFSQTDTSMFEVERYWGSQKIRSVLDLIAQIGEQKELVDQVVALSIKYSVLTPYTAFLVVEPTGQVADVENQGSERPLTFALHQNYPNPFNPTTTVRYTVGGTTTVHVKLMIYDMLGRIVKTLVADSRSPGEYSVVWDGTDEQGKSVSTGLYYCRLEAGGFSATRPMMMLK